LLYAYRTCWRCRILMDEEEEWEEDNEDEEWEEEEW
jgi:hypothetical protein